jgi:hypothetical protein
MYRSVKESILAFILLIILVFDASSQITSSPYSIFGLGSIEGTSPGTTNAMGETGIAFLSDYSLNLQNPASTAGLDSLFTLFEIGFGGRYTSYNTGSTRQSLFDANFRYFAMGFRISPRWATSFGIRPYSTIGYSIITASEIGGSSQTYDKTFSGEGGVNQIFLGNSYRLTKNLSIGINAVYLFGTVTHSESSKDFIYSLKDLTYLSNFSLNYGLNYQIVNNKWKYNIGLTYDNGKTLFADNVTTISTAIETTTLKTTSHDLEIPQSAGIGLAISKDFFKAGIDYGYRRWKGIEYSNTLLETRNTNRYSAGLEIPSLGIRRGTSRMIFFRLGAQYCESYMIIKGYPINYKSVSFGTGIPFKGVLSVINFSVELGQNGTMNGGLFKENFCTFHLDLSLKDIWFKKRKYM